MLMRKLLGQHRGFNVFWCDTGLFYGIFSFILLTCTEDKFAGIRTYPSCPPTILAELYSLYPCIVWTKEVRLYSSPSKVYVNFNYFDDDSVILPTNHYMFTSELIDD
jgi:hypothetical protein